MPNLVKDKISNFLYYLKARGRGNWFLGLNCIFNN